MDFTSKIKNWLYNISLVKGKGDVTYQASNNASVTEIQAIGLMQQIKRYGKILAARKRAATYMTKRLSKIAGVSAGVRAAIRACSASRSSVKGRFLPLPYSSF